MANSDLVVLNLPPNFSQRGGRVNEKTGRRRKARVSIDVETQPLIFDLSATRIGKQPAEAIEAEIKERLKNNSPQAAPATIAKRERLAKQPSGRYYNKRYGGGRIGPTPAGQDTRGLMFNDSGRLVNGLSTRQARGNSEKGTKGAWITNVPGNRLDRSTWTEGGRMSFDGMLQEMARIIDMKSIIKSAPFRQALRDGILETLDKVTDRNARLRSARNRALLGLGKAITGGLF